MARLIDADKFEAFVIRTNGDEEFVNGVQYVLKKIDNAPTIEAIPKEQYENRLKADMVAMLKDIRKDIIALPFPQREPEYMQGYSYCQMNILDYVIQDKINELKGVEDGKDN